MRARFRTYLAENESSDRSFGLVTSLVLLLIGLQPLLRGAPPRNWAWIGSLDLLLLATIFPRCLRLTKRAWLFLGFLLAMVVNPIVLGALFYLVIAPAGFLLRAFGIDPMRRRFDGAAESYWQIRPHTASRFEDQF